MSTFPKYVRHAALAVAVAATAFGAIVATGHRADAANVPTRSPSVARRHLALVKSEPAKNDTLTANPKAIKLWFTETVQAAATSIRLTGPANHNVVLAPLTVDAAPKSPAVVMLKDALTPGTYTVAWKTMADDGHPTNGTFTFTFKPAAK